MESSTIKQALADPKWLARLGVMKAKYDALLNNSMGILVRLPHIDRQFIASESSGLERTLMTLLMSIK